AIGIAEAYGILALVGRSLPRRPLTAGDDRYLGLVLPLVLPWGLGLRLGLRLPAGAEAVALEAGLAASLARFLQRRQEGPARAGVLIGAGIAQIGEAAIGSVAARLDGRPGGRGLQLRLALRLEAAEILPGPHLAVLLATSVVSGIAEGY